MKATEDCSPDPSGPVLAIVGSRRFEVPNAMLYADTIIRHMLATLHPSLVISGGAEGIDTLAVNRADLAGFPVKEFLPETYDWPGFRARNLLIVDACDMLVCIRCHAAETYGSGWTADRAKERGKRVYTFTL